MTQDLLYFTAPTAGLYNTVLLGRFRFLKRLRSPKPEKNSAKKNDRVGVPALTGLIAVSHLAEGIARDGVGLEVRIYWRTSFSPLS